MTKLKTKCRFDEMVPVGSLFPHPKNRNKHPEAQIERLAKMIEYQGIRAPIVVSRLSGKIVKGHGTLEAIRKAGGLVAPVVYQDFDDSDQEYAFVQGDNAVAEWAELDLSEINLDLGDLDPSFDIDMLGFKNFKVDVSNKTENVNFDAKLSEQFILTIHCESEKQLQVLFDEMNRRGFECKVIT